MGWGLPWLATAEPVRDHDVKDRRQTMNAYNLELLKLIGDSSTPVDSAESACLRGQFLAYEGFLL